MKTRKTAGAAKQGKAQEKRALQVQWADATEFKVPIPRNEKSRVALLHQYQILDTPPERYFDNITSLAALICGTPIALISLVDSERQWFKSKLGIKEAETARNISFCAHAIMQPDVFMVRDATEDKRFANSPLVTASPKIRFYAGAPIIGPDNHILGTICVIDHVPRQLTPAQIKALETLSQQVMLQLEMRRQLLELTNGKQCRDRI